MHKTLCESVQLSLCRTMTNRETAYIHDSWSTSNNVEVELWYMWSAPDTGFLINYMHTESWELMVCCHDSLQIILILPHFHCTWSEHYLCIPNSEIVNTNPKMKLHNGVGTEFWCHEGRKNLKSGTLKFRKIIHYLYRVLARATRNEHKCKWILNQDTLEWDSTVITY